MLAAHEPYPALALDRRWNAVSANPAALRLLAPIDPELAKPPVNVIRATLHPRGLSTRSSISRRGGPSAGAAASSGGADRRCRYSSAAVEASAYPTPRGALSSDPADEIAVPLRLRTHDGVLSMFSTVTVFGTAVEVTLSELTIEAFYPADAETAKRLRGG